MPTIKHLRHLFQMYWSYAVTKRTSLSYPPIRLWIEPTSACNLDCIMCPTSQPTAPKAGLMKLELFKKIIDEAGAFVYDTTLHHRGESTLHPDLVEMIGYASQRGIRTKLHTNATKLSSEKAREMVQSGLDYLSFSFDGFEKETYEKIRVKGSFDKTLENIVEFLRIKKSLGRRKPHTVLEVIEFPEIGNVSPDAKEEFMRRFKGLPLDELRIKPPHNWAGSYDAQEGCGGRRFVPCTFPWFALVIFWDGTVVTCPQDFYGEYPLGNVREMSLREIWHGGALQRLREAMLAKNIEGYQACSACDTVYRPTFLGVPTPNLRRFLRENLLGYGRMRQHHGGGREHAQET